MPKNGPTKDVEVKSAEKGPFPVFDPAEFSKLGSRNLEMATRAARAYFNGATQLNQELVGFLNARVKKDIETAQSFMTSKTSEDALHTQVTFFEGALRDYADEASKIMHLAADMAKETLTPIEERAEEALHNFEQRAAE